MSSINPTSNKIPKIIHYCWFGNGEMPELALKCIESWKTHLPDYEIVEWSEKNFDIKKAPKYVQEAYYARKYAFVTDYVRLYAIYNFGGIYMDTDVEVLKPLDKFLHHPAFSGFEDNNCVPTGIMASVKGGLWAKDQLEYYHDKKRRFFLPSGEIDQTTNVVIITEYMLSKGLIQDNSYQEFDKLITMYPSDYFCPKSWSTGNINITSNTHTIHHFAGSWTKVKPRLKLKGYIRLIISNSIDFLNLREIYMNLRYRK